MSFGEKMTYTLLGLVGIYIAARLISAAFFKSKQQFEQSKGKPHD